MSQKTITAFVYGKEYTLACDAGQEQHLVNLVHQVNSRTEQLDKAVGKLPEPLMLLYTALMLADELHDVNKTSARTKDELAKTQRHVAQGGDDARVIALEEDMAESLHALAGRLGVLAEKLAG
jgi:cell division protein ZapA